MSSPRVRALFAGIALAPALTAALLVRPAVGADTAAFGLYALTASAGSVALDGDIGAGGGLTVVDGGVPYAAGRLDSSPSASIRTAAIEPGTLVRTVAGVVNTEAGETVIDVPVAEASYPGTEEARADLLGSESAGPLTMTGLIADSRANAASIVGDGTVGELVIAEGGAASARLLRTGLAGLRTSFPQAFPAAGGAGLRTAVEDDPAMLRIERGTVRIRGTADNAGGILGSAARSAVGRITILDQIVIDDVVGNASVGVADGEHSAAAGVTVGGVTIAGVPFALGSDGLQFAGETVIPGSEIAAFNQQMNAVLVQAGIGLDVLDPLEVAEDGTARADSRGLRISLATPPLAEGGVPANRLTVIAGGAAVTLADEPPVVWDTPAPPPAPSAPAPPAAPGDAPAPAPATSAPPTSAPMSGGAVFAPTPSTAAPSGTPAVAAPTVAPTAAPEMLLVAGRPVSKRGALAAFGAWQLLSMTTVAMATVALGKGTP
jgi:hypothetical protein